MTHYHVWGSHCAKFDDDDFNNSVRGITCEGQTHTHRHTQTHSVSVNFLKVWFANKKWLYILIAWLQWKRTFTETPPRTHTYTHTHIPTHTTFTHTARQSPVQITAPSAPPSPAALRHAGVDDLVQGGGVVALDGCSASVDHLGLEASHCNTQGILWQTVTPCSFPSHRNTQGIL